MAFDKNTRNELASLVTHCRRHLTDEFTKQCQSSYGIRADGSIVPIDELTHLSDHELGTARQLRERITYLEANDAHATTEMAIDRMLREQAFTVMNRIAAMRMAEARGLIIESVSKGMESQGFEMYDMLGGAAMGERFERYQSYVYSMFDELAIDLGVLFDRYSPHGLLFPRETALKEFLDLLNRKSMEDIWAEDETIGWIYQYWNSKEERKAMRDASDAPRNSRELAVRNQFFTPRYVVEFLTDNTLGRIWYEMTKGETRLAEQCRYLVRRPTEIFLGPDEDAPEQEEQEGLSQEELLKQPVHIPHRPVKDPREIRLLDPACGSMHFGLYAFDLFEAIYEEAWDKGLCPALQEAYPEKADYLRDVPRLIIEHNIHGVDIDPRAVQIAGLSLWLRAQKTWKGSDAAERPRVRRSNIVCAEPMPGSDAMLEDFVQTLGTPLLGELVKTVFDKMQLAGEAGTLLKIEEEIRTAIDEAKAKWKRSGEELPGLEADPASSGLRSLTSDFWNTAEERIYAALEKYSESAEAGDYQRRLFAEDAAHGFAFIDLCRKRYDAVVMNPPFGEPVGSTKPLIGKCYKSAKTDLAMAFVSMALSRVHHTGFLGQITTRSFIGNVKLKKWRNEALLGNDGELRLLVDLGIGVLDALVEACAYVVRPPVSEMSNDSSLFFTQLNASEKGESLLKDIGDISTRSTLQDLGVFQHLPDQVMCYWLPQSLIHFLLNEGSLRETSAAIAIQGMQTGDDFRFYRLRWESPFHLVGRELRWVPVCKGGEYWPFYDDIHLLADWEGEGSKIKAYIVQRYPYLNGDWGWVVKNSDSYFHHGLTYPERTASDFSPRIMPEGTIFTAVGMAIQSDADENLFSYMAGSYTRLFKFLVDAFLGSGDNSVSGSAAKHIRAGLINSLPHPLEKCSDVLVKKTLESLNIQRHHQRGKEDTILFTCPDWITRSASIAESVYLLLEHRLRDALCILSINLEIEEEQAENIGLEPSDLDSALRDYGEHPAKYPSKSVSAQDIAPLATLSEESLIETCVSLHGARRQITKKSFIADRRLEICAHILHCHPSTIVGCPEFIEGLAVGESEEATTSLISYILGAAFGRWDIRYATGERQPPELPDPFDPLPVCPPGMLQNAEGLPAAPSDVPDDYPLRITWPGILVSDPGHPEDIVARVRDAFAVIWGDRSAAIEQEACEILGVRTLPDYFAEKKSGGKFFKDHLKRYSKSRRQAPIYWPLSTESGTYTLWIYYHRLDDQTLYSCIANFVVPKIEQIENDLSRLQQLQQAGQTDAQTSDEVAKLNDLLKELRNFQDELKRLAPIWKPNLNDGVQITAAPLWPLFRNKAWQKKLKETWTKLEKGDYDWAHLAYSIWPDRVKEKCKKDKSLAIAHDCKF